MKETKIQEKHRLEREALEKANADLKTQIDQFNTHQETELKRLQTYNEAIEKFKQTVTDQHKAETRRQVEQAFDFAIRSGAAGTKLDQNGFIVGTDDSVIAVANKYLSAIDQFCSDRAIVAPGEVTEDKAA